MANHELGIIVNKIVTAKNNGQLPNEEMKVFVETLADPDLLRQFIEDQRKDSGNGQENL